MADTYTHGHHSSVLRSHTWRTVENSAGYLIPHLHPGLDVLDVGCGPGTITADLAQRCAPGRAVGLDVAESVVAVARTNAPGVEFAVGDVYALDHPDASFDVVHAHQVLQHLTDPVAALRELHRVVRPDGVVAARDSDYSTFGWAPADERLDRWLELYRSVARANSAEPDAGRYLLGWAQQAGFTDITYTTSTWTFADTETRDWWGGMWAERILESAMAAQAIEYGLSERAELEELSAGFSHWQAQPDAVFVIVHGEIIARR